MPGPKGKEGICKACNKQKDYIPIYGKSRGLCKPCWKKLFWKPKLITCSRCKREMFHHGKGLCSGCFNSTFFIERTRELNAKKRHNIDVETYREVTQSCSVCRFDKIVDIHHLDHDHENNASDNLTGLCPNHHKMLHSKKHQKEVFDALREKGFKVPKSNLSDGFFKKNFT